MKGFTLVELLTVVVIIGVLASVALPQYRVAVEKARVAEAVTIGRSMTASQNRSLDAFPNEPVNTRAALDITFTAADGTWLNDTTFETDRYTYVLRPDEVYVTPVNSSFGYALRFANNSASVKCDVCEETGDSFCRKILSMGFIRTTDSCNSNS